MKVLIVGNGRFDNIISIEKYDLIICADGGFNNVIKNGIYPDIVIGDFDSIETGGKKSDQENLYNNIEFVENKNQSFTDIEKALFYCLENNYFDVTITGVTGLREDHFLYNLHLLRSFFRRFNELKIFDRLQVITATDFRIDFMEKMEYVSIFSLFNAVIKRSSGLLYPIDGMKLGFDAIQSQSNMIVDKNAFIEVESGEIIVFFPFKFLDRFKITKRDYYDT